MSRHVRNCSTNARCRGSTPGRAPVARGTSRCGTRGSAGRRVGRRLHENQTAAYPAVQRCRHGKTRESGVGSRESGVGGRESRVGGRGSGVGPVSRGARRDTARAISTAVRIRDHRDRRADVRLRAGRHRRGDVRAWRARCARRQTRPRRPVVLPPGRRALRIARVPGSMNQRPASTAPIAADQVVSVALSGSRGRCLTVAPRARPPWPAHARVPLTCACGWPRCARQSGSRVAPRASPCNRSRATRRGAAACRRPSRSAATRLRPRARRT